MLRLNRYLYAAYGVQIIRIQIFFEFGEGIVHMPPKVVDTFLGKFPKTGIQFQKV